MIIMHSREMQELLFEFYAFTILSRITLDELRKYGAPTFATPAANLPNFVTDMLELQAATSRALTGALTGELTDGLARAHCGPLCSVACRGLNRVCPAHRDRGGPPAASAARTAAHMGDAGEDPTSDVHDAGRDCRLPLAACAAASRPIQSTHRMGRHEGGRPGPAAATPGAP